jgi:hypothetical protein
LSLSVESASHSAVFFSHNKLANNTFYHHCSIMLLINLHFINNKKKAQPRKPEQDEASALPRSPELGRICK